MSDNYFSFLICFRSSSIDIYYNGLPIGNIINGVFSVRKYKMPDNSLRDLAFQDLTSPCEFTSIEELKNKVIETVKLIQIKENNEKTISL